LSSFSCSLFSFPISLLSSPSIERKKTPNVRSFSQDCGVHCESPVFSPMLRFIQTQPPLPIALLFPEIRPSFFLKFSLHDEVLRHRAPVFYPEFSPRDLLWHASRFFSRALVSPPRHFPPWHFHRASTQHTPLDVSFSSHLLRKLRGRRFSLTSADCKRIRSSFGISSPTFHGFRPTHSRPCCQLLPLFSLLFSESPFIPSLSLDRARRFVRPSDC